MKLFLVSLLIISSGCNKAILKVLRLTQKEKSSIGYFFLTDFWGQEKLPKVKYPFNSLSVMKVDSADFLEPILQKESFDIEEVDFKEDNSLLKFVALFKIQATGKKIKMATIFTSEEKINEAKISTMDKILSSTEPGFEERLQDCLNSNFPKKNDKIHEILFDEVIVEISCSINGDDDPKGVRVHICIYFEPENFDIRPGGKEQFSDQTDSKNIHFSSLEGKRNDALNKYFKNKESLLTVAGVLRANLTVDLAERSENTIKLFEHPQDEGIRSDFVLPFKMFFYYYVARYDPLLKSRPWDFLFDMRSALKWNYLLNHGFENNNKAVEIMDNHFKDWNADEEK